MPRLRLKIALAVGILLNVNEFWCLGSDLPPTGNTVVTGASVSARREHSSRRAFKAEWRNHSGAISATVVSPRDCVRRLSPTPRAATRGDHFWLFFGECPTRPRSAKLNSTSYKASQYNNPRKQQEKAPSRSRKPGFPSHKPHTRL